MLSKELIAASTRPLLLSILARGENYGYALAQEVKELSDGQISWSEGMLYPVLHRLEGESLIESFWKEGETGRARKYYKLAKAGKGALESEKEQWLSVNQTLQKLWKMKPVSS
jgi:PadR family transcriptional regulator, regulatory protein PadR